MKRKLLACGLITCILLSGCGNSKESKIEDTESVAVDTEQEVDTEEISDTEIETEQVADTEIEIETEIADTETTDVAGNESGNSSTTIDKVTHTHKWEPVKTTIHHEAEGHYEDVVIEEAWVEEVPVYEEDVYMVCSEPSCGMILDFLSREDYLLHVKQHAMNGENSGYHDEFRKVQTGSETITHPAVTEQKWVEDTHAYEETITTYQCSHGVTK